MSTIFKDHRLYKLLAANILSSIGTGISMIAIPWLLVNRDGGEEIYGYAALFMTLILFLLSPYVGVMVDRFSRKSIMLVTEILGAMMVVLFAVWGMTQGEFHTWQLIAVFLVGSLFYTVHYPTKFAFTQEIFDASQYRSLNSIMEIQGQTSSMIAGGVASVLIETIDLHYLLFIDAFTYVAAFVLISLIPYETTIEKNVNKVSMWANIKEGFLYLKGKPILTLFFISSFMPFIGVMVGNYLFPIYVAKTLEADATVMGMAEMIYAIGAILAGLTIPLMMKKWGSYRTIVITAATFTVGILTAAWLPMVILFLIVKVTLGWGNAGTRVARNTVMMEMIPNRLIGRVNSFFRATGLGMRVSLIGLFSQTVAHTGASFSLFVMGGILLVAFVGILLSQRLFYQEASSEGSKAV